jgi:hypothetical protein
LREAFVDLREEGLSVSAAQAALGYASPLMEQWDRQRSEHRNARHHLALGVAVEQAFWDCFETGGTVSGTSLAVGVGRSTGYRWWWARFDELRGQGVTVRVAAHRLRLSMPRARQWEDQRRRALQAADEVRQSIERRAVRIAERAHAWADRNPETPSQVQRVFDTGKPDVPSWRRGTATATGEVDGRSEHLRVPDEDRRRDTGAAPGAHPRTRGCPEA